MRSISATKAVEVAKTVTKPFYLIELGFTSPAHLCTRGDVPWNGYTWQANGAAVDSLRTLAAGAMEGRISLVNTDNSASALVLGSDVRGLSCKVWELHGDGPYAVADAVAVFDGEMDGCEIGVDRVFIDITTEGRVRGVSPRLRWLPPLANHMPAPGSLIAWGGEIYRLEGAE